MQEIPAPVETGRVQVQPLITHEFAIEESAEGV